MPRGKRPLANAQQLTPDGFLASRVGEAENARQPVIKLMWAGATAEAMRRILVENARRKKELKHGGALRRVPLDHAAPATNHVSPKRLVTLDEALSQLEQDDPAAADVFRLP